MIKSLIKKSPFIYKPMKLIHSYFSHERHRFHQFFSLTRSRNSLILSTMPRAGSHYLQMLLGNYWNIEYLDGNKRMGFLDIKSDIWNSEFDKKIKDFTPNKIKIHQELDLSDLEFEHYNPFLPYYKCKKIIYLYRNPFDNLLSRFHYFHVNRNRKKEKIFTLSDAIKHHLPFFIQHYKQMKKMELKKDVILVSYENLVINPDETLITILKFLGQRVNVNSVTMAIEFSKKEHVVNDEKLFFDSRDVIGNNQLSSFIRNPQVGQWREHFQDSDFNYITKCLEDEHISVNNFTI